jgi:hypothetical protein
MPVLASHKHAETPSGVYSVVLFFPDERIEVANRPDK